MVLFTDEYANIDGGMVPFRNLPMCENDGTLLPESGFGKIYGDVGSGENTLVYANHIHPYDGACLDDPEFTNLEKTVDACQQVIQQEAEKNALSIFVAGSKFITFIADICAVILLSSVPFSAMFINFILWSLESMDKVGIHELEIDVDGVADNVVAIRKAIMEKYK